MDLDHFEGDLNRIEKILGLTGEDPEIQEEADRPIVLVVDDDPQVLVTLTEVLGTRYRVDVYSGGKDLRSRWPGEGHAVVLDIKMPHEDGVSVFQEIRRKAPRIPILFYTAYPGDEAVMERARALDPATFLGKGCSLGELEAALREAIRRDVGPEE
jgi:DNA-binding response OmpR family regulator